MKTLVASITLALMALAAQAKEVIIDVRTPQEFAADRISGALNIEYNNIARDISKAGVSKDDRVILYCRSGRRSGIAMNTLKSMGYSKAENVGGIEQARKTLGKK
jgi:rhodanese-related sulfurtransferase